MFSYAAPALKPPQYLIAALQGAWRSHPRYRGCVGQWLLGEGGGARTYDRSASAADGTFVGSPAPARGPRGPVLAFDGVDDGITLGAVPALTMTTALSITAWIKSEHATNIQRILDKGNIEVDPWIEYSLNLGGITAGKVSFELTTGGVDAALTSGASYPVGTWGHLAATWDGTTMRLYLNGVEDANTAKSGTISTHNNTVTIAYLSTFGNTHWFNGALDDIRLYNRALSADEVASVYAQPWLEYRTACDRRASLESAWRAGALLSQRPWSPNLWLQAVQRAATY